MASESMFQAVLLLKSEGGFRATEIYFEKMIPTMVNRGDALELAKFIAFPRMAVIRWDLDADTRRKIPGSEVVVDVIGRVGDLSALSEIGRIDAKDLRMWEFPALNNKCTFPNAKEDDK